MENNPSIGLIMPKIIDPIDGHIHKGRRLLPTPFNIFGNAISRTSQFRKAEYKYRMDFISYDIPISVPVLSGAFMFVRTSELEKVGIFDEQFFMYFEDVDLCRRFYTKSKTLYYPLIEVVHLGRRESSKKLKLFKISICSAIKYFNKWGWFWDKERERINQSLLDKKNFTNNYV
jgi:GT2 family glycosyltransferase